MRDKKGRWQPGGESPNPAGKPIGALSPAGKLRQAIAAQLPEVIDALLAAARNGDVQAASVLLARALPSLRPSREAVAVDGVGDNATPGEIATAVARAAARGELPADVASDISAAIVAALKARDLESLEARLSALEAANANGGRRA